MKLTKPLLCGLMILFGCLWNKGEAQDVHYSQFYASPQTLNPALVGKFKEFYRVSFMHRSQYGSISEPLFATPSIGLDFSLFKDKLKGDAFGAGFYILHDRSGGGIFNIAELKASFAYHKAIGQNKKTHISLGIQPGYVIKWISPNDAFFADGYVDFNPNSGWVYQSSASSDYLVLTANSDQIGYFDLNAGLMASTTIKEKFSIYGGYAAFHLTQPDETFIGINTNTNINPNLPMRHVAHAGAELTLNDRIILIPGFLFQRQAKVNELNYGMTFGYDFPGIDFTLYAGLWHRWNESLIPKLGMDFKRFRLGFAYDFGVFRIKDIQGADINNTAATRGLPTAFEVNITYLGNMFIPKDDTYLFNPRF